MISEARKKRGEIDINFIKRFSKFKNHELLALLNDTKPQNRSVAAKILGERKFKEAIPFLCLRLSKEKSLYSKISISNAILNFGTHAIADLIKYIGKIGKNQHKTLPKDVFRKKSYPLPRDLIIRIIIRMGSEALQYIKPLLNNKSESFLSEIIDAIGHITYTTKNFSLLSDLLKIFDNSYNKDILLWKVIRSFQSFPQDETIKRLKIVFKESTIPAHRWEAIRSLAIINHPDTKSIIKEALKDSDQMVIEMAKVALTWK